VSFSKREKVKDMNRENGFTLIELLVVVAIIGVIAAIAIPQYAQYRIRAYDTSAKQEVKQLIMAEEAYMATYGRYVSCNGVINCETVLPNYNSGREVDGDLSLIVLSSTASDATIEGRLVADGKYAISAKHSYGSISWEFDSEEGSIED
jgi:prepilin-type N-terminal cleavage/methylation domain-containing protein